MQGEGRVAESGLSQASTIVTKVSDLGSAWLIGALFHSSALLMLFTSTAPQPPPRAAQCAQPDPVSATFFRGEDQAGTDDVLAGLGVSDVAPVPNCGL
jgi:hypothetical protein